MGKAKDRWLIELRDEGGNWHVYWPSEADERERTKLGLKLSTAKRIVADLVAPVTGYNRLGKDPHHWLSRSIKGHGMDPADVRIEPFRKNTWNKYED